MMLQTQTNIDMYSIDNRFGICASYGERFVHVELENLGAGAVIAAAAASSLTCTNVPGEVLHVCRNHYGIVSAESRFFSKSY